jgi:hypothetical protein
MPVLFDPAEQGGFALDSPPSPWISLGWIQNFVRKAGSKTTPVMAGIPAATLEQVRETLEAQVSLEFLSWTKLTMALATGSQHMNLLAPASGAGLARHRHPFCWHLLMRPAFQQGRSLRWMQITQGRRVMWARRFLARMFARR